MTEARPTEEGDLDELAELFEHGFGHPLTAEAWRWKYRRLPGESRSLVARDGDGRLVAHVGAIGLPTSWAGGLATMWQLVDFVGRPSGSLRPPVVVAGRRLLAEIPRPSDVPWVYGFPSRRHYELGHRVFGYRHAGDVVALVGALPGRPAGPVAVVESSDRCEAWAEDAWRACGVRGIRRTAEMLNWRYHARPDRYYRFYRLRGESVDGLVVAAFVDVAVWLAELWLPPGESWRGALLAVAADLAESGIESWRAWPPPDRATAELLAGLGMRPVADDPLILSCRSQPGAEGCCGPATRLHYAMGDYDAA